MVDANGQPTFKFGFRIVVDEGSALVVAYGPEADQETARPQLEDVALGVAAALEEWVARKGNFFQIEEGSSPPAFTLAQLTVGK